MLHGKGMVLLRDHFERLFRYDAWANGQAARAPSVTPEAPPEADAAPTPGGCGARLARASGVRRFVGLPGLAGSTTGARC